MAWLLLKKSTNNLILKPKQAKLKTIESSRNRLSLMAFMIHKNVWSLQLVATNQGKFRFISTDNFLLINNEQEAALKIDRKRLKSCSEPL